MNFSFTRLSTLAIIAFGFVSCQCYRQGQSISRSLKTEMGSKVINGTFGFYLRDINGCLIVQHNAGVPIYPSSTIKVLQLVHALYAVQSGTASQNDALKKYPIKSESCAENHEGHTVLVQQMNKILFDMMRESDNQSSNTIQEFFGNGNSAAGRQAINNTAHNLLGLSANTQLNHKFTCNGGPANNPANSITLFDLSRIYEKIDGGVLDQTRIKSLDSIIRKVNYNAMIDEIAAEDGIAASDITAFKNSMRSRIKKGDYDTGSASYFSVGGWVSLPNKNATPSEYVFSLYFENGRTINNENITNYGLDYLMRPLIRKSLSTYK